MTRSRWLLVGLLACCWLAGCGSDEPDGEAAGATAAAATSTSAATTTTGEATTTTAGFAGTLVEARVTGTTVETASRRVEVRRGDKVRIRVQADRDEEVHVHGYDLSRPVGPGRPAVIEFTADAPGVFEVELEEASLKLFELQVR